MLEFMGNAEQTRKKLLAKGISESELSEKIRKKKKEFGGLLNESAALFIIAKDEGVSVRPLEKKLEFTKLADLRNNQEDVNVSCVAERVYGLKTFERNGRKGSVCNIVVADDSGVGKLVLWNRDAEKACAGGVKKGDRLKVTLAEAKLGFSGPEVHLGRTGKLEKEEGEARKTALVNGLEAGMKNTDLLLRVLETSPLREFGSKGREGKVLSLSAGDATGVTRVVFWDGQAEQAQKIRENDALKIEGASVRAQRDGSLEVHVSRESRFIINPRTGEAAERRELLSSRLTRISGLKEGEKAEVHARVIELKQVKDNSLDGGGRLVRAIVEDESGQAEAVFHGESALQFLGIKSLADDVSLEVVAELKKEDVEGSKQYLIGKLEEREFVVEKVLA